LDRLINDQTLPGIMARMPLKDQKQWAKERPLWAGGVIEDASGTLWTRSGRTPCTWRQHNQRAGTRERTTGMARTGLGKWKVRWQESRGHRRPESMRPQPTTQELAVGQYPSVGKRSRLKCMFAELTGCTGSHPPWLCKAFGDKAKSLRITNYALSACCTVLMRSATQRLTRLSRLYGTGMQGAARQVAA
jgi:hypothetical protein